MSHDKFSLSQDGYFGLSLLDVGTYGGYLISNQWMSSDTKRSRIYFEEADAFYHHDHRAITVEGVASGISSPEFATSSLLIARKVARDMDELAQPFSTLDKSS